ncbi:hypothetical protein [Micromonospora sp. WMMD998]|uniref:hypothetical protein n=1 Tax=Micromonospora sp. WMMD998 TaxID=3016092 RepID=UPI00249BE902|nr:hypothetical protein [Micromonospora sp. WMMD998]WFE41973.1 hypothetical protein O7619_27395 [Micromonospora sp. WMMD998]
MAMSFRSLVRWLAGRPDPAALARARQLQQAERHKAQQRILALARARQAEYRYERRGR